MCLLHIKQVPPVIHAASSLGSGAIGRNGIIPFIIMEAVSRYIDDSDVNERLFLEKSRVWPLVDTTRLQLEHRKGTVPTAVSSPYTRASTPAPCASRTPFCADTAKRPTRSPGIDPLYPAFPHPLLRRVIITTAPSTPPIPRRRPVPNAAHPATRARGACAPRARGPAVARPREQAGTSGPRAPSEASRPRRHPRTTGRPNSRLEPGMRKCLKIFATPFLIYNL